MTTTRSVDDALTVLFRGGVVAIPTETVYGLAADADSEAAVRRVYAIKGRPLDHPVIVHVSSVAAMRAWGDLTPLAEKLAKAFCPGPITLVVPRKPRAESWITGGQDTVGLRIPAHPLTLELLRRFEGGLAAPSANRFGAVSPTTSEHVAHELGTDVDLVLDGGPCEIGLESTIVDCTGDVAHVLRPGGVSVEAIEEAIDAEVVVGARDTAMRAPGLLASHYAPRARVEIIASPNDAKVAEKSRVFDASDAERGEVAIARELYATLRASDEAGLDVLYVVLPEERGLGRAIADRLRRAAAPRLSGTKA